MLTTEQLRRKARVIYNNDMVPEHINRHNQRQWVRAVLRLGGSLADRKATRETKCNPK